jgi:putative membrane protein
MLYIILILVIGLVITFFAAQNSALTTVSVANYTFEQIPLYVVIILSLLVGFFISWLLSLVGFISSSLTIFGKDRKINETTKTIEDLKNKIHQLEIENAQLNERSKSASLRPPNRM